ncbi:SHOCT domain-containing protein [Pseudaquabacterium rugosum]|uniref:SHOCT domain-containing protein n=1 Tax=Pseudaquabacterium rugosum TaxID=2984194 RepID=A0ABU9BDG8_9BURK
MRQLSPAGQDLVQDIARRHGFSPDGVLHMLDAVIAGNGGMAQFSHPDFSGSGQWMSGGMTMVSDMFNQQLAGRVASLCAELARVVAAQPDLVRGGSFQSPSQGGGTWGSPATAWGAGAGAGLGGNDGQGGGLPAGHDPSASLFVPGTTGDWWPSDLRWPDSTGAQNQVRYAYFSQAHRLVIDIGGTVTVYDTLDHHIGGFGQQQSGGGTLSFTSQYGLMDVTRLPVVSSNGQPPQAQPSIQASPMPAPAFAPAPAWAPMASSAPPPMAGSATGSASSGPAGAGDVLATLERLGDLRAKGIVSDAEFAAKKAELLARL